MPPLHAEQPPVRVDRAQRAEPGPAWSCAQPRCRASVATAIHQSRTRRVGVPPSGRRPARRQPLATHQAGYTYSTRQMMVCSRSLDVERACESYLAQHAALNCLRTISPPLAFTAPPITTPYNTTALQKKPW